MRPTIILNYATNVGEIFQAPLMPNCKNESNTTCTTNFKPKLKVLSLDAHNLRNLIGELRYLVSKENFDEIAKWKTYLHLMY